MIEFEAFMDEPVPEETVRIMFSERGGGPMLSEVATKSLVAIVGPEGGWDDRELSAAASAGFEIVTLGGRTLRAETAAIAVTAILLHKFGDMN